MKQVEIVPTHDIVYKVVQPVGPRLISASGNFGNPWTVEYVPRVWVKPPGFLEEAGYGLTCFEDFGDAYEFTERSWHDWRNPKSIMRREIWECDAYHQVGLKRRMEFTALYPHAFINPDLQEYKYQANLDWPAGTLMYMQIRLRRFVL